MLDSKKIAFLCHPYHRGGVTRWMADAALEAGKMGNQVYFITVEPKKAFNSSGGKETLIQLLSTNDSSIKIISEKVGIEFEFGDENYRAKIYYYLITKNLPLNTPIILSDDPAIWNSVAQLANKYLMIGVIHSDHPSYYSLAKKYDRYLSLIVCVSKRIQRRLAAEISNSQERLKIIPCGIMLEPNGRGNNKKELNLIYVGRIGEMVKRTSDLVKIGRMLKEKLIDFHLTIIGDGEEKTDLEKKFSEQNLSSQITFLGWVSNKNLIYQYLSDSDFLLITSNFEGMPIVMMEALSAGASVIATRVSGIEDYENHPLAKNCLWVNEIGNVEEAVSNIEIGMKIPREIRQKNARSFAESEFDLKVCLDRYFDAINSKISSLDKPVLQVEFNTIHLIKSHMISLIRFMKIKFIHRLKSN